MRVRLICRAANTPSKPYRIEQLDLEQKELPATAVQAGLVTKAEDAYSPQFMILKHSEYLRLTEEIFAPIVKTLEPVIEELAGVFDLEHKKSLPVQVKTNIDYLTYLDISTLTYYAVLFGAGDGLLAVPKDKDVGRLYTLVMTYNA